MKCSDSFTWLQGRKQTVEITARRQQERTAPNLIKGPFYEPTWVHHYQRTIKLHAFVSFFVKFFYFFCFVCFWYTVRSPFGSINCDSLFTGIWASESSVVRSAQREEGLLQPEAAQQNWWAPSSSPSSLGKQHGGTARQNRQRHRKAERQEREDMRHTESTGGRKADRRKPCCDIKSICFYFKFGVHRALSDADVTAV